ncbi:DVU_1557 family redox protein [Pelotomaculum sp. FP]|nr:CLJU_RS11820 family redox protein [Pelotomaculum sp. FP]
MPGVTYLDNNFKTDLPRCPRCGLIYVPEELAGGKMLELEQTLEDK